MRLFDDSSGFVAKWVGERVGVRNFGEHNAIGVLKGDKLVAGVIYSGYTGRNIEMTVATEAAGWRRGQLLKVYFAYPFEQLGCARITARVARSNKKSLALVKTVGFKYEGCLRKAAKNGDDVFIFGMLRHECKILGEQDVERRSQQAA